MEKNRSDELQDSVQINIHMQVDGQNVIRNFWTAKLLFRKQISLGAEDVSPMDPGFFINEVFTTVVSGSSSK